MYENYDFLVDGQYPIEISYEFALVRLPNQ